MGAVGAAFGIGFTLGPVLGGLISHLGLHVVGLVSAGVMLLDLILIALVLPEPKHHAWHAKKSDDELEAAFPFRELFSIYAVAFVVALGFS